MSDRRMQSLQRLRSVVLDAFPERTDLEQQLWFQLGVRLDEIAADSANLTETVFELLQWAEAHGRTDDLLRALVEARPDRDDLKQLLQEVDDALGPTAAARLRRRRATGPPASAGRRVPALVAVYGARRGWSQWRSVIGLAVVAVL